MQEEVSFASQYRKAIPPRGLHRAGNRSPELGQSVIVHRGNWGRTQAVHSTRFLLQTRAQPLRGCTKVAIPVQGQRVLSLSRHLCRQTVGCDDANSTPNSLQRSALAGASSSADLRVPAWNPPRQHQRN